MLLYKKTVMQHTMGLVFFLLSCVTHAAKDLIVGTLSDNPPYGFINEGVSLSGFDIDLMSAICKKIKRNCSYKIYNFDQLAGELAQKKIDLAIGAIIITPEREKRFLFSEPYKISIQQYMVLSTSKLLSPSELQGKVIGLYNSSPEKAIVYKQFPHNTTFKFYGGVEPMLSALRHKTVDAILLERPQAFYWVSNASDLKLLGGPFSTGEGYGIIAQPGQEKLMQEINKALEELEQEGTYLKIYQLYF